MRQLVPTFASVHKGHEALHIDDVIIGADFFFEIARDEDIGDRFPRRHRHRCVERRIRRRRVRERDQFFCRRHTCGKCKIVFFEIAPRRHIARARRLDLQRAPIFRQDCEHARIAEILFFLRPDRARNRGHGAEGVSRSLMSERHVDCKGDADHEGRAKDRGEDALDTHVRAATSSRYWSYRRGSPPRSPSACRLRELAARFEPGEQEMIVEHALLGREHRERRANIDPFAREREEAPCDAAIVFGEDVEPTEPT